MTKERLLTWAVVALVALNLALIIGMVVSKPGPPPGVGQHGKPQRPKTIIIDRLDLDEGQTVQYEALIEVHQDKIFALDDEISGIKKKLYATLNKENQPGSGALLNELASKQRVIEETHFQHFADIRSLCRENQLGNFEKLSVELSDLFKKMLSGPRPKNK